MKPQHTPTPWYLPGEHMKHDASVVIRSADNMIVALAVDFNSFARDAEKDANAEFIVRAVNSHKELLEALKDAFEIMRENGMSDDDIKASSELLKIEQAIAKAEGK